MQDVRQLSFPLQIVATIVMAVLSAVSAVWVSQSGIKETLAQIQSDQRNIITKMESQEKVSAAEVKAREAVATSATAMQQQKIEALDAKLKEVERNYQLADYNIRTEFKDSIAAALGRKR